MDKTRALQRAVRRYPLGTKALAAALDMKAPTLNHKASPTYLTQWFSPEEAIELQLVTGDHGGLQVEAAALGYTLQRRRGAAKVSASPASALSTAVGEFGGLLTCVTKALEDDDINGREMAEVDSEIADLQEALQVLRERIAERHEGGKPAHLRKVARPKVARVK
ncbi:phage regulatory CII family protein [Paucibacter sp. R3-3]|uniref:Phage regulatory CII family protein n=1 Tax=Roseateles agri TaxID=3098619 RepID=A0ABU5DQB0_9BURK|nr:phage regulatory CII family protein [Paucibacter sp. R3-3]MDY0748522.1 phage regulatory CII family protein [Paucibacter sp. R3-3]